MELYPNGSTIETVSRQIRQEKIVAILRGISFAVLEQLVDALYSGGVRILEVTYNTNEAGRMIEFINNKYGDKMVVGAGTVTSMEMLNDAIKSGAKFVLAPGLDLEILDHCCAHDILAVPGVLTPTEISSAMKHQARIVKIFPAGSLGPAYIKDLHGPFDQLEVMVVGGVGPDNLKAFFKAGAMSAGIGSDIVNKGEINAGRFDQIKARAERLIMIAQTNI